MSSPSRPRFPVFHTPLSLLHNPPTEILSGRPVPYVESPTRYHRILEALLPPHDSGGRFEEHKLDWERDDVVTPELLAAVRAVHGEEYLAFLREIYDECVAEGGSKNAALPETFLRQDLLLDPAQDGQELSKGSAIARIGRFSFDLSAPVTADTYISALASARLALFTLTHLISAPSLQGAFALCRPPGHHSTPHLCGGYCFLNNAAIAARAFQAQEAAVGGQKPRVAILDIDYHHGNGTSKVFWDDPSVLYVSLHAAKDYPWYTGAAAEVGGPFARGTNINYPLPLGTGNEEYLAVLREAVEKLKEWKAELLIVSLGVDTYIDDPLTDFRITLEAYPEMGRVIGGTGVEKTLFLMEGGYCLDKLGECVKGVLEGFVSSSGGKE
ncbi:hypothetical protein JCM6882_004392 [Rhodosporidiobolus microsporus]